MSAIHAPVQSCCRFVNDMLQIKTDKTRDDCFLTDFVVKSITNFCI